jgi:uncharacterized protein YggE
MKILLPFLLLSFLTYENALAQAMGNYNEKQQQMPGQNLNQYSNVNFTAQYRAIPKAAVLIGDNILEISVNALSNQKADTYTAIFSVLQLGKTAEETNNLMNSRINAFVSDMKSLGVAPENIYIDMVNFLPKYENDVTKKLFSKKTFTEIPKGFEMQKNVHVSYTKPEILDDIVTAASRQEIYDIVKVDYFVREQDKIYLELRKAAIDYLEKVKTQLIGTGIKLDSAYTIAGENAWVAYPMNRYESYQAYSSQSIDPGDKNANINLADKPVSRFYNAIPANDYDVVINPSILEPAVQFSYNLVMRFTMPERKIPTTTVTKKEFIMVTPAGEVKTLKVE